MNRTVPCGLFFISAALLMGSCQRQETPSVATVGSHRISADDLRTRLSQAPVAYQQYAASPEGRQQFVKLLIREKLLLVEAKRLGIAREKTYQEAMDRYKEDAKRRLTEYENTLLIESVLQRLRSGVLAATDTEVEKYYQEHRAEYERPVEVSASHILLSSENEARQALARITAKEPFDRVAREMSKDPATAVRGGRLAPFRRGTLVPEFESAAFALKAGSISGIVKSQFGFHIIKKLGEKTLEPQAFAQVKDEIRAKLEREKFDQWVAAQEALIGVRVNQEVIAGLSLEESLKP